MSTFCFFLVSCGGGGDDVYDEYNALLCKSTKMSYQSLMGDGDFDDATAAIEEAAEFLLKNADKMQDMDKLLKAQNVDGCATS